MALKRKEDNTAEKVQEKVASTLSAISSENKSSESGGLKRYNLYLSVNDYERLKTHFDEKRISASSGIRMVLREYMKREGL